MMYLWIKQWTVMGQKLNCMTLANSPAEGGGQPQASQGNIKVILNIWGAFFKHPGLELGTS